MRKNHDKRRQDAEDRFDRVYVDWPQLYGVRQLIARPMKTIYINRSAESWAQDKEFSGVYSLENFCDRWGLELP